LVATRELLPFTWLLLALAIAVEFSACMEHWVRERWVVAIAADLAILLMTYIVTRPGGIPEGYARMSREAVILPQIALLAIYLAGMAVRTLGRGFTVTGFEITQSVLAFCISLSGAIRVAQGSATAILLAGYFSAACGAICYLASYVFLRREHGRDRNFYTYATFGLMLGLAGALLLLNGTALVALWASLGFLFVRFGRLAGRMTLKWHGAVYLLAAVILSEAKGKTASRFLSATPHPVASFPSAAECVTAVAAVAALAVVMRGQGPAASWGYRILTLALAALGAWTVTGVAAGLLAPACQAAAPDFCATILTGILTVVTFGSAMLAKRSLRRELVWLTYSLLVVATYKLVFQDLRMSATLGIVLSLVAYGGMLIVLPRIVQKVSAPETNLQRAAGVSFQP
jgi:hypothetical protein